MDDRLTATGTPSYPVIIEHLLVSPGHNYFGRPADGPGEHATYDRAEIELVAGKGIVGDRFFGKAAHMDASLTLIAAEAVEAVAAHLGLDQPLNPLLTRRNVVIRGADLNALIGAEFTLRTAIGEITLAGRRPAAPCVWMDRMLAPGAHAALRGRGGLRCQVLTSGRLSVGRGELVTTAAHDAIRAALAAVRAHRLP